MRKRDGCLAATGKEMNLARLAPTHLALPCLCHTNNLHMPAFVTAAAAAATTTTARLLRPLPHRNPLRRPRTVVSTLAMSSPDISHSNTAWRHWRALGSPRYVVAPMVDGSELAFRDLCRRHGATLAYTPMLNSKIFAVDPKYRAEHFTTHAADRPLVAQFCANDPATFVGAARHVQHAVDAVDLNLGCPQGIARRGHYGAFLQDDWELLQSIVRAAAESLDVPVWVKIRVFDSEQRTISYARMLQDAGVSLIAVHGRTREQKGKAAPPADWAMIRAVQQAVAVPVLANGNVRCKADADAALRATGAEGVLSAWALLDNPATFTEGAAPSRMQLARDYLELAGKYETPMRMVRLHMFKMLRGRLDANMDLNENVAKCKSVSEMRDMLEVLAQRSDFDGVSFEERVVAGNVPENVVNEKRLERLRNRLAA